MLKIEAGDRIIACAKNFVNHSHYIQVHNAIEWIMSNERPDQHYLAAATLWAYAAGGYAAIRMSVSMIADAATHTHAGELGN